MTSTAAPRLRTSRMQDMLRYSLRRRFSSASRLAASRSNRLALLLEARDCEWRGRGNGCEIELGFFGVGTWAGDVCCVELHKLGLRLVH